MARKWTQEQSRAINTRDRTLLVSAAAGSGKTATLTERIIRSILDDEHPADIGRMLIVTFTNAAVGELRDRIGAAIKTAFSEHPDNKRLEQQLLTVKDAKIMTISSFCNDILKNNSARVGLPPSYRIADDAEAELITGSVMEPLINLAYEGELPEVCSAEEFADIADCLTSAKGASELAESFKLIYKSTECYADRMGALLALCKKYDPESFTSVEDSEYGKYIMDKSHELFCAYRDLYESSMRYFCDPACPAAEKKVEHIFESDLSSIKRALAAESYTDLRQIISSISFPRNPGVKGQTTAEYARLNKIRSMYKEDFAKLSSLYFTYSEEEWRDLYTNLYKKVIIIYKFIKKFDEIFTAEKKSRAICQYGDLERYAYMCLYEGGERTELAKELAGSFEAVYIDEYQDVNDLENAIFAAVSREDNRFMVGDIKQSIYGFRLANPDIFAAMKKSFPPLGSSGDYPGASLFMSNNFRSDKTVIDFANGVFDSLFGALGDSIGYVNADRLEYSKVDPEGSVPVGIIPEIHVLSAPVRDDAGSAKSASESEEEEIISTARKSARTVAAKIRELIDSGRKSDGSHILPSDIAIMMRSTKTSGEIYKDELARLGIGASIKDSGSFFLNEEILLALSLLNSIDNPRKDIYLASLMCSPLFSFTPDELVLIRRSSEKETLYEALVEYCKREPEFTKGAAFLRALSKYRAMAEGMSVDTLLALLYRDTGLLALAAKSGGRENLILLHSYARRFESSSFKGLYSFISYINSVIADNESFELSSGSDEGENSVNILTVHKSKGLEYPICFFVGTECASKKANTSRLLCSQSFGIALKEKDPSGLAVVENPIFNVIRAQIGEREYEEELRVLYVALTRPREQLYIYGTPRGKLESFMDKVALFREIFCPYIAKNLTTVLYMIAVSFDLSTGRLIAEDELTGTEPSDTDLTDISDRTAERERAPEAERQMSPEEISALADELYRRFTFVYPRKHLTGIPSKLSVSRLYPEILDGADDDTALLELPADDTEEALADSGTERHARRPILPRFAEGSSSEESAKRGIATHLVLQFCDFERLERDGAAAEVKRLEEEKFISAEDARRVRLRELEAFVRSPLFTDIKRAQRLHRELRFNVKLPASIFTADEERRTALSEEEVLVQGVIDCLIEMPDGSLKLIDYKTDRLRPEEKAEPALAEERLAQKHKLQLSYYRLAIMRMFGKAPAYIGIYSLAMAKEIEVKF